MIEIPMNTINNQTTRLNKIAKMFKILSEVTCLQIFKELMNEALTVNELVKIVGTKQANMSKQLGILFKAGLVSRTQDGNFVRYFLPDERFVRTLFERVVQIVNKLPNQSNADSHFVSSLR